MGRGRRQIQAPRGPQFANASGGAGLALARRRSKLAVTRDLAELLEPSALSARTADELRGLVVGLLVADPDARPAPLARPTLDSMDSARSPGALAGQWQRLLHHPDEVHHGVTPTTDGTRLRMKADMATLEQAVAHWEAAGHQVEITRALWRAAGSPPSHVANMRLTALVARIRIEAAGSPVEVEVIATAGRSTRNPKTQARDLRALAGSDSQKALIDRALEREPEAHSATFLAAIDGIQAAPAHPHPARELEEAAPAPGCDHSAGSWALSAGWDAAVFRCEGCGRDDVGLAPLHRIASPAAAGPEVAAAVASLRRPEGWVPYRARWQVMRPLLGEADLAETLEQARDEDGQVDLGQAGLIEVAREAAGPAAPAPALARPGLREILAARR